MLKPTKPVIVIFLAPAILFYLIIFLYPTFRTTVMSFFAVENVSDSVSKWSFNGIANYIKLFNSPIFIRSLKNIFKIWFVGGAGVMFMALVLAIILTNNTKGSKFFRSVIFLPNIISAVAMGTMWLNYVYNPEYGLLSNVLGALGFEAASKIIWTGPGLRFWAMLVAYGFGSVGYYMLIFISGIEQIPKDFYEAAIIEGAGTVRRFFLVTAPFLRGVTRTNFVIWSTGALGFFVWSQVFSPLTISNDTVAPMNYLYELVFGQTTTVYVRDSGASAAIGVLMVLAILVVFFVTSFIIRNDDAKV